MTYEEFKKCAMKTAMFEPERGKNEGEDAYEKRRKRIQTYLDLGVRGEAGEVCDKLKKLIRDKDWWPGETDIAQNDRVEVLLELGDVMWYVAMQSVLNKVPMGFRRNARIAEEPDEEQLMRVDDVQLTAKNMLKSALSLHTDIDHGLLHLPWLVMDVATIAQCLGSSLEEVCKMNVDKLRDRFERGKEKGSGDHR